MIKTNETCEEDIFKRVYLHQLAIDEALEKMNDSYDDLVIAELQKKIENLHTELNKKVVKNKNQKEQITILLKQKENYKQLQYDYESLRLQSNKKMKEVQNDFKRVLDDLNKTIDLLEDRIKEKDTIISYLEGKLK